jgi:heterodisulfide reductase subunit B
MKIALFHCCQPRAFLKQGESIELLFKHLGIEPVEIKEFNCCGYPLKNINFMSYITASARNLALAGRRGLDLVTYCSCCYGSMKQASHIIEGDEALLEQVNGSLVKEGLEYISGVGIKHYLEVCYSDIGLPALEKMVRRPFRGMKVAAHHGCHLMRPKKIIKFCDSNKPRIYDQLIGITGAESVNWSDKQVCCSAPIWGSNDDVSMGILQRKIENAGRAGADFLCTACVNCQLQFDRVQKMMISDRGFDHPMPSLSYIQLLGLSLGIEAETLHLDSHEIATNNIMSFL